MADAWIVGMGMTAFARHPEHTHQELAASAVREALTDAGVDGGQLGSIHVGCAAGHAWGQPNIRGQVVLDPLLREGELPAGIEIVNVEGGCATGGLTLSGAVRAVRAGDAEVSLAVGVDKTFLHHDLAGMKPLFEGAIDQLEPARWQQFYAEQAAAMGLDWAPDPRRIVLLDIAALKAAWHMQAFGTTREQAARVASKNHAHSVSNERAQYRVPMSVDAVLADKTVAGPLTRSMCAPISDGAAAAVVVGASMLRQLPAEVRERAVRVAAIAVGSGTWRSLDASSAIARVAHRAYAAAELGPDEIDLAEVHDNTAFAEIMATEALGFCPVGEGGSYAESGATSLGGARPVNPSGGLESKGHPLAASGLGMVAEAVTQLRGEAGPRQVSEARTALVENGGGVVGFDEAAVVVAVLQGGGRDDRGSR